MSVSVSMIRLIKANTEHNQGPAMTTAMTTTITDTIAALWAAFEEHHDDLERLGIIADAYRDQGNDQFADCLEWCRDNGRKPKLFHYPSLFHYPFSRGWGWRWLILEIEASAELISRSLFRDDLGQASPDQYQHVMHNQPTISAAYIHLCQFWIGS